MYCVSPGDGLPQSWSCCCKLYCQHDECAIVCRSVLLWSCFCYLPDLTGGPVFCWSDPQCWCLCLTVWLCCLSCWSCLVLFGLQRQICTYLNDLLTVDCFPSLPPCCTLGCVSWYLSMGAIVHCVTLLLLKQRVYISEVMSMSVCFQLW